LDVDEPMVCKKSNVQTVQRRTSAPVIIDAQKTKECRRFCLLLRTDTRFLFPVLGADEDIDVDVDIDTDEDAVADAAEVRRRRLFLLGAASPLLPFLAPGEAAAVDTRRIILPSCLSPPFVDAAP